MRRWMSAAVAGAVLATAVIAAMPAQAAWKSYINKELGISFMAPGEVKAAVGNFRGAIAGPRQTIVYRSVEDNIEYKVTVMSFLQAQAEGANILAEREYMFQDRKNVLMDTFARVGSGKDAVYGRKYGELPWRNLQIEISHSYKKYLGCYYEPLRREPRIDCSTI